jgi:hypothetical protein
MPISTVNQKGLDAPLSLTAPNLGTPSALVLTNATALPKAALPTGSVLQVVYGTPQTSPTVTSSTTYVATSTTATITPQFSSSKIVVIANGGISFSDSANQNGASYATLYRDSTDLGKSDGTGLTGLYTSGVTYNDLGGSLPMSIVDSPSSTSAITYKVYVKVEQSGLALYYAWRGLGTIILMEIAA